VIDVGAESNGERPLVLLDRWLSEARAAGVPEPGSVAFVTVGEGGRPSARTVSLKRLEDDALVFTSALWTRKAREIELNPQVALLFHWPTLGRQVHIAGLAAVAERELAVQLFSERELSHRVQTLVSRQGEPIDQIEVLRARHAHLMEALEAPPECPPDWGAIRVIPNAVEFWLQAPDRMHDRLLYERVDDEPGESDRASRRDRSHGRDRSSRSGAGAGGRWSTSRLSP
jgi:pyridoxamine 5'-phosphate oxidase